jgi:hypothetical protein
MSTKNSLKLALATELGLWLAVGDIRIVIVAGAALYAATWMLGMIREAD